MALATSVVVGVGASAPVGADPDAPEGTTRTTSFTASCSGDVVALPEPALDVERLSFAVTAPTGVLADGDLTVRIAPQQRSFRDPDPLLVGSAVINFLADLELHYELPTHATVHDVAVVAGSGRGLEGTPTVEVDTDHSPHRIVLRVPRVPRNPVGPAAETPFTLPAIDLALTATGAPGTTIDTRLAGTSFATAGYVATADVTVAGVHTVTAHRCWPVGDVAAPVLSRTAILAGETTVPSVPTGVAAQGRPGYATVTWTPPVSDGGTAITGYIVTASPGGAVRHAAAGVSAIHVPGLPPGTPTTFTVTAQNLLGSSAGVTTEAVVVQQPTTTFDDVPDDHVFFGEITWLAEAGITRGSSSRLFQPSQTVTRQTMAALLYRLWNDPSGADPVCDEAPFTDVAADDPFCGEITWLADAGIAGGYPDGSFHPTQPVSRQSAAALLHRTALGPIDPPPPCDAEPFTDVTRTHLFCGEITWLADAGIAGGYPDGSFRPTQPVSRQTAAALLDRLTLVTTGPS